MKCLKKLSNGLRFGVIVGLLLALSLPLSAWSFWPGDQENVLLISQLRQDIAQRERTIESLEKYITQLETQLNELLNQQDLWTNTNGELESSILKLRKQLEESQNTLQLIKTENGNLKNSLKELETQLEELIATSETNSQDETLKTLVTQLQNQLASSKDSLQAAQVEATNLKNELAMLKELSGLSEGAYDEKLSDFQELQEAYDQKAAESAGYYEQLMSEKKRNGLVGMFGSGVTYKPDDGTTNLTLSAGIGYGDFFLTAGVQQPLNKVMAIDVSNLTYTAGIQYQF